MITDKTGRPTAVYPTANFFPGGPSSSRELRNIHWWIYVYFFLLIFEGALRKWIFYTMPAIADILLLVRDPIVVIIYFLVWRAGLWPKHIYMYILYVFLGIFIAVASYQVIAISGMSVSIAIYGIRSYCLHLPLIFVLPAVMNEDDVLKIGKWIIKMVPLMTVLMIMQFIAPANHFLNRSGAEGGEQIGSALGKIRMAGTFSYNTGAAKFYLLATAFFVYSYIRKKWLSVRWRMITAAAILMVIPISGSRTLMLSFAITMGFTLVGAIFNPRLSSVIARISLIFAIVASLLVLSPTFQEGLDVFRARWDEGLGATGQFSDAITNRFFGDFSDAFDVANEVPNLGNGLGIGSNVAAKLKTGDLGFLLAEAEWPRTIMEMGAALGFSWLLFRCTIAFFLLRQSWIALRRNKTLAWLLLSTCMLDMINATMEQSTSLGFIALSAGLTLAALNPSLSNEPLMPPLEWIKKYHSPMQVGQDEPWDEKSEI
jgi:hypothetical protein